MHACLHAFVRCTALLGRAASAVMVRRLLCLHCGFSLACPAFSACQQVSHAWSRPFKETVGMVMDRLSSAADNTRVWVGTAATCAAPLPDVQAEHRPSAPQMLVCWGAGGSRASLDAAFMATTLGWWPGEAHAHVDAHMIASLTLSLDTADSAGVCGPRAPHATCSSRPPPPHTHTPLRRPHCPIAHRPRPAPPVPFLCSCSLTFSPSTSTTPMTLSGSSLQRPSRARGGPCCALTTTPRRSRGSGVCIRPGAGVSSR